MEQVNRHLNGDADQAQQEVHDTLLLALSLNSRISFREFFLVFLVGRIPFTTEVRIKWCSREQMVPVVVGGMG
ncbi:MULTISPECIES: hypothetical protein [Paenibacillus]|jgi:hypothetical protein|uniref:hypothetical protein n=1 Tax=Paenibacillus TaxID=44249 RepID=UPI000491D6C5|nr:MULTISPECIES: hypothetical protein [Paenibacillus]MCM3492507.1 hypothetical protein [Paenibacillus lactis]